MRFRKYLKIGAHELEVCIQKEFGGSDESDGSLDLDAGKIYIKSTIIESKQESTLFHEIMHCLNSELDHTLLDSLAEQIYSTLKENDMLK